MDAMNKIHEYTCVLCGYILRFTKPYEAPRCKCPFCETVVQIVQIKTTEQDEAATEGGPRRTGTSVN